MNNTELTTILAEELSSAKQDAATAAADYAACESGDATAAHMYAVQVECLLDAATATAADWRHVRIIADELRSPLMATFIQPGLAALMRSHLTALSAEYGNSDPAVAGVATAALQLLNARDYLGLWKLVR